MRQRIMPGSGRTGTAACIAAVLGALVMGAVPAAAQRSAARQYTVRSPDGLTEVTVALGDSVTYAVSRRGRPLIATSPIALTVDGTNGRRVLGRGVVVRGSRATRVDTTLRPVVPTKSDVIFDRHGEIHLDLSDGVRGGGGFALEVRAYDTGVAWRWVLDVGDSAVVASERATFRFTAAHHARVGLDSTMMTHYEPQYRRVRLDSLRGKLLGLMPLLVSIGDSAGGPKVAITESGLEGYPGMYLVTDTTAGGSAGLAGVFPAFALEEHARTDRDLDVVRRAPYLARTSGRRALPWRAILIADDDRALLENQLVYELAPAQRVGDVSWVKPGLVSWDWWNALNLRGVPFRAGINTATYRYYIDFAARHHLAYIILDEGWSPAEDVTRAVPAVDVAALVQHGDSVGVGIVLWALWTPVDRDMTRVFDQWRAWGVKGAKIDFMQRDDQRVVDFYWRAAREAAERHLTLDFHGAHKPAGLNRAYPNVLSFEGVRGMEHNKWSETITPEHDVTLPFTRMLAGPMDFTPGAMSNAQPGQFRAIFEHPMSQGTRAHQLAMYVVYESPLQMLADAPTEYEREPDMMAFLERVPTVWSETRALGGRVGEYVMIARRRGTDWYLGAMTNGEARTLTADLSFLGAGAYTLESWSDGPNADRNGTDYQMASRRVTRHDQVKLRLAPGGGYAARIRLPQATPEGARTGTP